MKATITALAEACRPQVGVGLRARRTTLRTGFALAIAVLFVLGTSLPDADAQRKRRKKRRGKRSRAAKVDKKPDRATRVDAPDDSEGPVVAIGDDDEGGDDGDSDVKAQTRETKDAQVFDFTGLELGGQLRMPQLLYFLDRADEELQRASLEKRSFIPEMSRSLDEEGL